jgi:hypothetical protein
VLSWLQYIRRNSQPTTIQLPLSLAAILNPPSNRFKTSYIINFDETPIPFEYIDQKTYNTKSMKTVTAKTDRSGWDKRQASLILYIFADGVSRILFKLIFHGKPTNEGGKIKERESRPTNAASTFDINIGTWATSCPVL